MKPQVHQIEKEFVVLSPDKKASTEVFDDTLYERLESDYGGFSGHELISCHVFDRNWSSWEVHPKGDEIVMLLSGKVTFLLELDTGIESVEPNSPGSYLVVPRNIWHTAQTNRETRVLFITPGENTGHKGA